MANHKHRKAKNRRAGCLWCRPWERDDFVPFADIPYVQGTAICSCRLCGIAMVVPFPTDLAGKQPAHASCVEFRFPDTPQHSNNPLALALK